MKEYLTFDDVLIKPKFSNVASRKDVDLSVVFKQDYVRAIEKLALPVLSANMDTVTSTLMAIAIGKAGGLGVLHRFMSPEDNVHDYREVRCNDVDCAVSVGVGEIEQQRAKLLWDAGAKIFVLDVAHGAQTQVVAQYKWIKETLPGSFVVVGNFATAESCARFWGELNAGGIVHYTIGKGDKKEHRGYGVDAFKIGIGPGSACTTRIKTGCGIPQLGAVMEVAEYFKDHLHRPMIICDGGMKTSGDIAKALAAGADCVMLGGMLAGTDETPGDIELIRELAGDPHHPNHQFNVRYKRYRGSASKEAYADQGKDAKHRTAEGESFLVKAKGPVAQVLQDIEGGLRSALTYVGAKSLEDFKNKAEFVKVTANGQKESAAHGKSN